MKKELGANYLLTFLFYIPVYFGLQLVNITAVTKEIG